MPEKVDLTVNKSKTSVVVAAKSGMPAKEIEPKKKEVSFPISAKNGSEKTSDVNISANAKKIISDDPKLAEYGIDLNKPFKITPEIEEKMEKKGEKGFLECLKDGAKNTIPFVSGYLEIKKNVKLLDIARKQERKEALTKEEKELLYSYMLEKLEEEKRGSNFMGKVATALTHLPAFAGEFMVTGGLYSAAKFGAKKVVTKITGKVIDSKIKQTVGKKVVDVLAVSAFRTPLTTNTYANIYQRRLQIAPNDKQEITLKENKETFATSVGKAIVDSYIENLSEQSGVMFGFATSKMLGKIPKVRKLLAASPKAQKFMAKTGFHGVGEEFFEERFGGFLRGAITLDKPQDKGYFENLYNKTVPTLEQAGVELTTSAIWGGAMRATHATATKLLAQKNVAPVKFTAEEKIQLKMLGVLSRKDMSSQEILAELNKVHSEICDEYKIPQEARAEIVLVKPLTDMSKEEIESRIKKIGIKNWLHRDILEGKTEEEKNELERKFQDGKIFVETDDISKMKPEDIFDRFDAFMQVLVPLTKEKKEELFQKNFILPLKEKVMQEFSEKVTAPNLSKDEYVNKLLEEEVDFKSYKDIMAYVFFEYFNNNTKNASYNNGVIYVGINTPNKYQAIAHETAHEYSNYLKKQISNAETKRTLQETIINKIKTNQYPETYVKYDVSLGGNNALSAEKIWGDAIINITTPEQIPEALNNTNWLQNNLFNSPPERFSLMNKYLSSVISLKWLGKKLLDDIERESERNSKFKAETKDYYEKLVEEFDKLVNNFDNTQTVKNIKNIFELFFENIPNEQDKEIFKQQLNNDLSVISKFLDNHVELEGKLKDFLQKIETLSQQDTVQMNNKTSKGIIPTGESHKMRLLSYICGLGTKYYVALDTLQTSEKNTAANTKLSETEKQMAWKFLQGQIEVLDANISLEDFEYKNAVEERFAKKESDKYCSKYQKGILAKFERTDIGKFLKQRTLKRKETLGNSNFDNVGISLSAVKSKLGTVHNITNNVNANTDAKMDFATTILVLQENGLNIPNINDKDFSDIFKFVSNNIGNFQTNGVYDDEKLKIFLTITDDILDVAQSDAKNKTTNDNIFGAITMDLNFAMNTALGIANNLSDPNILSSFTNPERKGKFYYILESLVKANNNQYTQDLIKVANKLCQIKDRNIIMSNYLNFAKTDNVSPKVNSKGEYWELKAYKVLRTINNTSKEETVTEKDLGKDPYNPYYIADFEKIKAGQSSGEIDVITKIGTTVNKKISELKKFVLVNKFSSKISSLDYTKAKMQERLPKEVLGNLKDKDGNIIIPSEVRLEGHGVYKTENGIQVISNAELIEFFNEMKNYVTNDTGSYGIKFLERRGNNDFHFEVKISGAKLKNRKENDPPPRLIGKIEITDDNRIVLKVTHYAPKGFHGTQTGVYEIL